MGKFVSFGSKFDKKLGWLVYEWVTFIRKIGMGQGRLPPLKILDTGTHMTLSRRWAKQKSHLLFSYYKLSACGWTFLPKGIKLHLNLRQEQFFVQGLHLLVRYLNWHLKEGNSVVVVVLLLLLLLFVSESVCFPWNQWPICNMYYEVWIPESLLNLCLYLLSW